MRHSAKDLILVFIAIFHIGYIVAFFISWPLLSGWQVLVWVILHTLFICTNYQCIAHNHIHNPFFRHRGGNECFSVLNSLSLAMPESLYRIHHLNHHRFSNDAKGPTNTTGDWSSIYRYGKNGTQEGIFSYAVLSLLRTDFPHLFKEAKRHGVLRFAIIETLIISICLAGIFWFAHVSAGFVFIGATLVGQMLAFLENYAEHDRAVPGDRLRGSVSSYNELYNWLWFNNGYHSEHHAFPGVHWTKIREYRPRLPPEDQRRIVPGNHLVGLFRRV